ncbi:MAG TPA: HAD family hydrolase [Thermoanaerobaculia bacterium]|nr:HAD family hydrolase [Thermoanaerobaculia bacterium]
MISAIAFDLWETLITNTPDVSREQKRVRLARMEDILVARGHGALAHRIDHAHRMSWQRCQELYWSEDRDVPCRRQIEIFLETLELDPSSFDEASLGQLERAYAGAAVEVPPVVIDGAAELLAALKSRGLGVGLISNTGRTPGYALREILSNLGLAQSIDVMVFSNEHGECKPQLSIFEALRGGLGVPYSELLFVGDNLYVDVHGAQRCGMKAVHFAPSVRGDAVAPHVEHGLEITPDATVTSLREVLDVMWRADVPSAAFGRTGRPPSR